MVPCFMIMVLFNQSYAQTYCTPSFSYTACASGNDFWITQVQFGTLNFTGGACASGLQGATGAVTQGQSYNLTVVRNGNAFATFANIYVDWNDDGDFVDAGETIASNLSYPQYGTNTNTISNYSIPYAATGSIRLRVLMKYQTAVTNACTPGSGAQGEYKDFEITVNSGVACSGTPEVANISPASSSKCSGTTSTLSLTGLTPASGYTYQWKSSDVSGGPYTNASGTSTNATYITPATLPSNPTYYICEVTCDGNTTSSNEGSISVNSYLDCYCRPSFAASNAGNRGITRVEVNGTPLIGNSSTVNSTSPYYTLYTAASPVSNAGLTPGLQFTAQITVGSTTTAYQGAGAWIDYNQNGTYESSEYIGGFGQKGANTTTAINFTVPADAIPGTTGMRVIGRYINSATPVTSGQACASFTGTATSGGAGECEDYRVLIIESSCTPPDVQASAFTSDNVHPNTATIGWTRGDGDAGVIVVASTIAAVSSIPMSGTAYTASPTNTVGAGGGGSAIGNGYVVYQGTGNSVTVNGLPGNATTYFKIWEYNTIGLCYLVTSSLSGTVVTPICDPPNDQVSDAGSSNIQTTSATISWTNGSGDKTLVIMRQGAAVATGPAQLTAYTGNSNFNYGSPSGTAIG